MDAHLLPLLVAQRARLVEDLARRLHLADVLEHRRELDEPALLLVEAQLVVGHDQLGVDLHAGAEAGADRAGSPRAVEGELPRLELVDGDVVAAVRDRDLAQDGPVGSE